MEELMPDKWVEIDLDRVEHNYRQIRAFIPEQVGIMGVVKAEAYGLGGFEVASLLEQLNIDYLAVTYAAEALTLRERGINAPLLVFAPVRGDELAEAVRAGLTLTVDSALSATVIREAAQRQNRQVRVHIKVDTGLSRFGLEPEEVLAVAQELAEDEMVILEGIYTHFAEAGAASPRPTLEQFTRFQRVLQELTQAGIKFRIRHCCNSAAALRFPQLHLDMVRVGTLLGGQYPPGNLPHPLELKEPYFFKSHILSLKPVPPGRRVGYGGTYRTRRPATLAVIPVGYQDGLGVTALTHPAGLVDYLKWCAKLLLVYLNRPRADMMVKIRGREYPIRGKVFMQMCVVELPDPAPVVVGETAVLPVRRTVAAQSVTRIYLRRGEPGKREVNRRISTYMTD